MKIYTYSKARAQLAEILEESKTEEVIIQRRKGDMFTIVPRVKERPSPFNVTGLNTRISRNEILEAVKDSREKRQNDEYDPSKAVKGKRGSLKEQESFIARDGERP